MTRIVRSAMPEAEQAARAETFAMRRELAAADPFTRQRIREQIAANNARLARERARARQAA